MNMTKELIATIDANFREPGPRTVFSIQGAENSFSIEASGLGEVTGIAYTVPAHTTGTLTATLNIRALTSDDVKNLNDLAMSMVSTSKQQETRDFEKTSASADLSLWTWFFGGANAAASYESTHENMVKFGLTSEQITKLMDAFLERAKSMSKIQLQFTINNSANDYSVDGNFYLYTISGQISTKKGDSQYRMLASEGAAGGPPPTGGGAPSSGKVIKL